MPEAIVGENALSDVTTAHIVYDDIVSLHPRTTDDAFPRLKRCSLHEFFLASSLMVLTAPALSVFDLRMSEMTHLSIAKEPETGIAPKRSITLREAREIALRAHHRFEEGLREDRIHEARLMDIGAANEQDA